MHLLIACSYWGYAGTERAFIDHAHALVEQGNRVTALVHPAAPYLEELRRPGIGILPLEHERLVRELDTPTFERLLTDVRPDAVLAHTPIDMWQLRPASAGRVPFIGVCHSFNVKYAVGAELAIALNEVILSKLLAAGHPAARAVKLPNMIRIPAGHTAVPRPYQEPVTIGALGRLSPEKGMDILIDALNLLAKEGLAFRACIGGDGDERARLEALIQERRMGERVALCGWIHDKQAFYDSIDIFCLPSRFESFGIVLLEAALRALPIVAAESEGAREVFQGEPSAVMVEPGSPQSLASGLRRAMSEPAGMAAMAARAHAQLTARCDMARVGKQLDSLLRSAVDGFVPSRSP